MKGLIRSLSRGRNQLKQNITRNKILVKDLEVEVSATGGGVGWGTVVAGDIPEGNVLFLGAAAYLTFAGPGSDDLDDDWTGGFAVGTIPDEDGTLTGAEVDLILYTAIGAAEGEKSPRTRGVHYTQAMFNNTDGSLEVNLNVLIDAAKIGDDKSVTLTVNGEIELVYIVLGDD
jgi:hypothetical protein